MENIADSNLKDMFTAGLHLGYSKRSMNPKMSKFIYGVRNNVGIFDVQKTDANLKAAGDFIASLAKENKQILLVGTKEEAKGLTEDTAAKLGMPYVSLRWLGGTLTNFKIMRERIDQLDSLVAEKESGGLDRYKKKERTRIEERIEKLGRMFGGVRAMKNLPAALVVVDPKEENIAVTEARKTKIPIVALANSDVNPEGIDYLIPGNDASRSSIVYFLNFLAKAYGDNRTN